MDKIRAFVFDLDGLLLDTERIALASYLQACREHNFEPDLSVYYRVIGGNAVRTKQIFLEGFGKDYPYDAIQARWVELYHAETWEKAVRKIKTGLMPPAGAKRPDISDQPAIADLHLHLAADLPRHADRRVLVVEQGGELGRVHRHARAGAGDLEHGADALDGVRRAGHRPAGLRIFVAVARQMVDELLQVGLFVHVLTAAFVIPGKLKGERLNPRQLRFGLLRLRSGTAGESEVEAVNK